MVVEVEAGLVQSNHALPLSEGHDPECGGYFDELLETVDEVGIVDVVAALTGKEVVVVEVEAPLVQSNQALPLSAGHDPEWAGCRVEEPETADKVETVEVVAALTYREVEVEVVEDTVIVQSSHALPFSDGQALPPNFPVENLEVVVSPSTTTELEVVVVVVTALTCEEVDEIVRVQSSHWLPFSDGHELAPNLAVEVVTVEDEDEVVVSPSTGTLLDVVDFETEANLDVVVDSQSSHSIEKDPE